MLIATALAHIDLHISRTSSLGIFIHLSKETEKYKSKKNPFYTKEGKKRLKKYFTREQSTFLESEQPKKHLCIN